MPNWCSNSIEIVGPRDKIRAVWEAAKAEDKGLLNALRPRPVELEDTTSPSADSEERQAELFQKYGSNNWYDWSVNNWGTKWDISLEGLEYEEDEDGNFDNGTGQPYARITGWFDSAWSPPVSAISHYGARNEDVKITLDYYEPGMGFVGRYTVEEGVDDDEFYDYSGLDSKTVRDAIGADMDDMWNISEQMAEWEAENEEEDA